MDNQILLWRASPVWAGLAAVALLGGIALFDSLLFRDPLAATARTVQARFIEHKIRTGCYPRPDIARGEQNRTYSVEVVEGVPRGSGVADLIIVRFEEVELEYKIYYEPISSTR